MSGWTYSSKGYVSSTFSYVNNYLPCGMFLYMYASVVCVMILTYYIAILYIAVLHAEYILVLYCVHSCDA